MAFPSPSLTPPNLANWQFSYNGLTFGASTSWGVTNVEGLDLATIRAADVGRPRDHGELVGLDVYGGRDITVDLWMQSDGVSLQDSQLKLAAATEVGLTTEQPLWFQLPNLPLLCVMCRPRKRTMPLDVDYGAAMIGTPSIQFHATDPRIYAAGQASAPIGLPNPTAGMTFPATFPLTFGASTANGLTVTNGGNTEMRPILVINGPVTNPTIQNATISGTPYLTFTNPTQTSYTVAAGDQLVVDLDLHTVLYYTGGQSSGTAGAARRNWFVYGSTWWTLQPGGNLIQFLSKDSVSVAGNVVVQFANAYQL